VTNPRFLLTISGEIQKNPRIKSTSRVNTNVNTRDNSLFSAGIGDYINENVRSSMQRTRLSEHTNRVHNPDTRTRYTRARTRTTAVRRTPTTYLIGIKDLRIRSALASGGATGVRNGCNSAC